MSLRRRLSPNAVALAPRTARSIDWRALGSPHDPGWTSRLYREVLTRVTNGARIFGPHTDVGIHEIIFLVLMEAIKSAQEDLKAIMAEIRAINTAKAKMRDLLLLMVARAEGQRVDWPPR